MKRIVLTPQPILSSATQPVTKFDDNLNAIIMEMEQALLSAKDPKGVGLAASQIGYPLKIFAMKPKEDAKVTLYINPKIIEIAQVETRLSKQNTPLEGCLSIPNTWGVVNRKTWVTLSFQNSKGKSKTKKFRGFPAIIVQHEMDHLSGILFTQRVLAQQGKLYEIVKDKQGKESLKELPL